MATCSQYSFRKLLAVDYLGAALTLAGCTLVILPLIWVCNQDCLCHRAHTPRVGRSDLPLVISSGARTVMFGVSCSVPLLLLGMERRKIAYRTQCVKLGCICFHNAYYYMTLQCTSSSTSPSPEYTSRCS